MCSQPTARQIERWIPTTLKQIAGNKRLTAHLVARLNAEGQGPNLLIDGPSSTGKTAAILAFIRALQCGNRSGEVPVPCGVCMDCQNFDIHDNVEGLFADTSDRTQKFDKEPMQFYHVNCGEITEPDLRRLLLQIRSFCGTSMVYLDEVHRIIRGQRDHLLLKPMRELDAVWIASSVHIDQFDDMFLRRFACRISTELPSPQELADFIAVRCREWEIEVDERETIAHLVNLNQSSTHRCLQCLSVAALQSERRLTRELVETRAQNAVL